MLVYFFIYVLELWVSRFLYTCMSFGRSLCCMAFFISVYLELVRSFFSSSCMCLVREFVSSFFLYCMYVFVSFLRYFVPSVFRC